MTAFLASVASPCEAASVLSAGVDILDLKDPSKGALGAWPVDEIAGAVKMVAGQIPVSATVGDLPLAPETLCQAVRETAQTGVDFVKVGFFLSGDLGADAGDVGLCLSALGVAAREIAEKDCALVAVFFADQVFEASWVVDAARAGFKGVMLDTADKTSGGLRAHMDAAGLEEFVTMSRENGLFSGLAGSLRLEDVAPLLDMGPDYLGFRGALCRQHERTAIIDAAAVERIKRQFADHGAATKSLQPLELAS